MTRDVIIIQCSVFNVRITVMPFIWRSSEQNWKPWRLYTGHWITGYWKCVNDVNEELATSHGRKAP